MLSPNETKLLKAVFDHPLDHDVCFLCAESLTAETRSDDHVIPKWVQNKYNLWNEHLWLRNRTSIPYRQLTIPCCKNCNNERLSNIESKLETAVSSGYDAVTNLPKVLLFQWLGKIFLGLQYKDLQLLWDRSNPSAGPVSDADSLRRFSIMHFLLMAGKGHLERSREEEYCPASTFIFRTQKPPNSQDQFDLVDITVANCLAIRLGDVGIIADFLENGIHARLAGDRFVQYEDLALHPLQFKELAAIIAYRAMLIDMETDVEFYDTSDGLRAFFRWNRGSPRQWNPEEYAYVLAEIMQFPEGQKAFEPGVGTWTCLHNKDGSIRKISLSEVGSN